ncbi:MAG: hypothetical protein ACOY3Y_03575 [Acidobacteriota bacterium]
MRARQLKPGFFTNEQLAECSPFARILFAGLWGLADREGRLEDRPAKIRVHILPFDSVDVETLLCELASKLDATGAPAFIVRYEVDGVRLIQIVNFHKHQNPHIREPQSELPPPSPVKGTGPARGRHRARTVPAPGGHGTRIGVAPGEHQDGPASSLTPDSGLRTPSSLTPSPGATPPGGGGESAPGKAARFKAPTAAEVQSHLDALQETRFTGEEFVAHYKALGWKAGGQRIEDWRGKVDAWRVRRDRNADDVDAQHKRGGAPKPVGGLLGLKQHDVKAELHGTVCRCGRAKPAGFISCEACAERGGWIDEYRAFVGGRRPGAEDADPMDAEQPHEPWEVGDAATG